jgi:hypothetical protein
MRPLDKNKRLTSVNDDQDSLPSLVDLGELGVLEIKDWGDVVEVVLQGLVTLDDDRGLALLGDFGGKIRHGGVGV